MEPAAYVAKMLTRNGVAKHQMRKSFTIERKLKEQFDALKETIEVLNWMEEVLGERIVPNREGDQIEADFLNAIQDGTILCRLLVTIEPGSIPRFHNRPKLEFLMIENAQLFLNACQEFGVSVDQLCEAPDIIQKRNLKKITRVVSRLYQIADERGYDIPPMKRSQPKRDLSHQNEGFIVSTKAEPRRKRSSSDMVAKNLRVNKYYYDEHTQTIEKMFSLLDRHKRGSISSVELEEMFKRATGKRSQHKLSEILQILEQAPKQGNTTEGPELSFKQFEETMDSIEEQTSLFPLVLESDHNQQIYMLPRRFLTEEAKAFNEIYGNNVIAVVEPKKLSKSEFIRELKQSITGNASDEEIMKLLLAHSDNSSDTATPKENFDDFIQCFSLAGDDALTATTLFNKDQVEKLRILFSLYAPDGSQTISKTSVRKFLERVFREQKDLFESDPIPAITPLLEFFGADNDNSVNFVRFIQGLGFCSLRKETVSRILDELEEGEYDLLRKLLLNADLDHDGFITPEELQEVLSKVVYGTPSLENVIIPTEEEERIRGLLDYFSSEPLNGLYMLPNVVMDFYKVVDQITELQNDVAEDDESVDQLDEEIVGKSSQDRIQEEQLRKIREQEEEIRIMKEMLEQQKKEQLRLEIEEKARIQRVEEEKRKLEEELKILSQRIQLDLQREQQLRQQNREEERRKLEEARRIQEVYQKEEEERRLKEMEDNKNHAETIDDYYVNQDAETCTVPETVEAQIETTEFINEEPDNNTEMEDVVEVNQAPDLPPAPVTLSSQPEVKKKKIIVRKIIKKDSTLSLHKSTNSVKLIETYPKPVWLKTEKEMTSKELSNLEATVLIRKDTVGTSSYRDKQLDFMRKDVAERKQEEKQLQEQERQVKAEEFQQWLEYTRTWREQIHQEKTEKQKKANKAKYLHKKWIKEREICDVKAENEKTLKRISANFLTVYEFDEYGYPYLQEKTRRRSKSVSNSPEKANTSRIDSLQSSSPQIPKNTRRSSISIDTSSAGLRSRSPSRSPAPSSPRSPHSPRSPRSTDTQNKCESHSTTKGSPASPKKMSMAEWKKNYDHNCQVRKEMKEQYQKAKLEKLYDKFDAYYKEQAFQKEAERREREDLAELNYSFSNRAHHNLREEIRNENRRKIYRRLTQEMQTKVGLAEIKDLTDSLKAHKTFMDFVTIKIDNCQNPSMRRIRKLSQSDINKLRTDVIVPTAAQVVEELILNSIDARSTKIELILHPGRSSLMLSDDGEGMDHLELEVIGERYERKDKTFGFRGEALSSISLVSNVEIISRSSSSQMTFKKVIEGSITRFFDVSPEHRSFGSTIKITDLFQLPTSRTNLRDTLSQQLDEIRLRIQRIALIHPHIAFSAIDADKATVIVESLKLKSSLACFATFFGNHRAESLKEVSFSCSKFEVEGYLSSPFSKGYINKSLQFLYVNKRFVMNTAIHDLINLHFAKTFKTSKNQAKQYPMYIINIKCIPAFYDVSFQPDKQLVEFEDWEYVVNKFKVFLTSHIKPIIEVSQSKSTGVPTPVQELKAPRVNSNRYRSRSAPPFYKPKSREVHKGIKTQSVKKPKKAESKITVPAAKKVKVGEPPKSVDDLFKNWNNPIFKYKKPVVALQCPNQLEKKVAVSISKDTLQYMKVINQVDNKFILAHVGTNLFIFDQHAVDERIRLEALEREILVEEVKSQFSISRTKGFSCEVSHNEGKTAVKYRQLLESWGWKFSLLEKSSKYGTSVSLEVTQIPTLYNMPFIEEDFTQFLTQLEPENNKHLLPSLRTKPIQAIRRILNYKACRSAIKFNTPLSIEQCEELILKLQNCDLPFQCAHGRPSVVPLFTSQ